MVTLSLSVVLSWSWDSNARIQPCHFEKEALWVQLIPNTFAWVGVCVFVYCYYACIFFITSIGVLGEGWDFHPDCRRRRRRRRRKLLDVYLFIFCSVFFLNPDLLGESMKQPAVWSKNNASCYKIIYTQIAVVCFFTLRCSHHFLLLCMHGDALIIAVFLT